MPCAGSRRIGRSLQASLQPSLSDGSELSGGGIGSSPVTLGHWHLTRGPSLEPTRGEQELKEAMVGGCLRVQGDAVGIVLRYRETRRTVRLLPFLVPGT